MTTLDDLLGPVRATYACERAIFLDGARMKRIVKFLGATDQDLCQLRLAADTLPADPTLPFRRSRNARFQFDFAAGQVRRLAHRPFVLSADEDFVRADSGRLREFAELEDDFQRNTAVRALLTFQAAVLRDLGTRPRPQLNYAAEDWVCTMFHLRTITTPQLVGEPALEGVHSDGVDHTMTTFLGADNMADGSATTHVHDNRESTSARWYETRSTWRMGEYRHETFLDTLLLVDHERKHSVSPVLSRDPAMPATRDMLILFTRKPMRPGHPAYSHDGCELHPRIPFSFSLEPYAAAREHR